jgi:hypothetical protein
MAHRIARRNSWHALKLVYGRAPLEIAEFASGCFKNEGAGHSTGRSGYQVPVKTNDRWAPQIARRRYV